MSRKTIADLYALPLAEFTAARNELAKALRTEGDRAAADEVKALAKPSVAAWAVNQLFHTERKTFDRLMAAAAAQRQALARGTSSRMADERKRAALAELLRHAERRLEDAGSRWTPSLRQRVHRTLEALTARPPDVENRPGRLTGDLQPAGFDALLGASIAPAPARPTRRATKAKRPSAAARRRREVALERVRVLQSDLAAARRRKSSAAKALAGLERQASAARKRARAAERRAKKARSAADDLELGVRRAKTALDQAASEVARTEARLEAERRKT